jgi:hypothetical protein
MMFRLTLGWANVRSDKRRVGQTSGRTNVGSDKCRVGQTSGRTNARSDKLWVGQTSCFSPRSDKRHIFSLRSDKCRFLVVGRTNVGSDSRTNCGSQKTRVINYLYTEFDCGGYVYFVYIYVRVF